MFKRIYYCGTPSDAESSDFMTLDGVTPETLESFKDNKGEEGT